MAEIIGERIKTSNDTAQVDTSRATISGGWLVRVWNPSGAMGVTFVPDPKHEWK
jgi:hypothetical protein